MGNSRVAEIPFAHMWAEMAAFPFVSESAFRCGITGLDPEITGRTRELWRAAEREVLGGFPAFSVDEAVALRDHIWFTKENGELVVPEGMASAVPLGRILRRVAREVLEGQGASARPSRSPSVENFPLDGYPGTSVEIEVRRHWRWLTFAIPEGFLLASLAVPPPARTDILSPLLERDLLERGYADPHLHLNAAMDFPVLWVSVLRALADPGTSSRAFESPGASFDEGRTLGPWLLRASIARYLLAGHLFTRLKEASLSFAEYLNTIVIPGVRREAGATAPGLLRVVLQELREGRFGPLALGYSDVQWLYRTLIRGTIQRRPRDHDEVHSADPVEPFFPWRGQGGLSPELQFLCAGLQAIGKNPKDILLDSLFWQVVRLEGTFYRHVVVRPLTPGLRWFVRFFQRLKPARKGLLTSRILVQAAVGAQTTRRGLRSLEVRVSPEPDLSRLLDRTIECVQAANDTGPSIEFGLVFHISRIRGGNSEAGAPLAHDWRSNADPRKAQQGYRFAELYQERLREVLAVEQLLDRFPRLLTFVRGIDACTDELGIPTWVVVPLYERLRRAGELAARLNPSGWGLPLRATAHAGEEFIHLLGGLRRVDEAIEYLPLREGDRIGHATALGVDPLAWAQNAGRIPLQREERLLDLSWEWSWYAREGTQPPPGRIVFVEREIARLTRELFGKELSLSEMENLARDLHTPSVLRNMGFPDWRPPRGLPERLGRVAVYLTSPSVFERGRPAEWIDPAFESEVLRVVQRDLRRKVGRRGLVVEINPTSNLLIGNLGDLARHPLWRLRPPSPGGDAAPVSVCIGSDDPVSFAASLPDEYQLLCDALTSSGLSDDLARAWLEDARRCGLAARFTLPASALGRVRPNMRELLLGPGPRPIW